MASKFTKNDLVRLDAVVPSGRIEAFKMDADGVVYCKISWLDADGVLQTRWFPESMLVAVA